MGRRGSFPRMTLGEAEKEIRRLRKLAREAIDHAEEANGDPSSCSYNVPIGERLIELRKEVRRG